MTRPSQSEHKQGQRALSATEGLPPWASELVELYESNAANQFILYGNVNDRILIPGSKPKLGNLDDFLAEVLLGSFDVVLSYDLGAGLRPEKGAKKFADWPSYKDMGRKPRAPREAMQTLNHYFRYCANLRKLKSEHIQVACVIRAAQLAIPALQSGFHMDVSATAMLVRDWSTETILTEHGLAVFLLAENLNDLNTLIVNNPRAATIKVPLPSEGDLEDALGMMRSNYTTALSAYGDDVRPPAKALTGATLSAIESLLKTKEHRKESIAPRDLVDLKKDLVEKDTQGLIEFIDSKRTLDDYHGQEPVKEWIRQDVALWNQGEASAMPMGYLLCGPVGTGKTYLVECLAGEAGVPVVKFKNFRDKWVGSTEGNLEKIFRLLQALDRCVVFIDEADQTLGKRDSGQDSSGVSGRVYSMMAQEMSKPSNRGRILWILASSRPDLIEVDLKRPGRVDVKIPIFPTTSPEDGFFLIRALCGKHRVTIPKDALDEDLKAIIPDMVTPGAAESLAIKVFRLMKTRGLDAVDALRDCLTGYQSPVPEDVMAFQIGIAVREASDAAFVPERFKGHL